MKASRLLSQDNVSIRVRNALFCHTCASLQVHLPFRAVSFVRELLAGMEEWIKEEQYNATYRCGRHFPVLCKTCAHMILIIFNISIHHLGQYFGCPEPDRLTSPSIKPSGPSHFQMYSLVNMFSDIPLSSWTINQNSLCDTIFIL
jgi:hypothetical protein